MLVASSIAHDVVRDLKRFEGLSTFLLVLHLRPHHKESVLLQSLLTRATDSGELLHVRLGRVLAFECLDHSSHVVDSWRCHLPRLDDDHSIVGVEVRLLLLDVLVLHLRQGSFVLTSVNEIHWLLCALEEVARADVRQPLPLVAVSSLLSSCHCYLLVMGVERWDCWSKRNLGRASQQTVEVD